MEVSPRNESPRGRSQLPATQFQGSPFHGMARALTRAIVCTALVWCLSPLARAIEIACVLASVGAPQTTTNDAAVGVPLIGRIGAAAGVAADAMVPLSMFAMSGLAALALASFFIVVRTQSPRAGAVLTALVLFGSLALGRNEVGPVLARATPSLVALAAVVGLVVVSALLAWRWIEDVALAAAVAPTVDPLAIDARIDNEAAESARNGPISRDSASRQLRGVLGIASRVEFIEESGLSGRGSPIPRVMPNDEPITHAA